jgi:hypothetical protein
MSTKNRKITNILIGTMTAYRKSRSNETRHTTKHTGDRLTKNDLQTIFEHIASKYTSIEIQDDSYSGLDTHRREQ